MTLYVVVWYGTYRKLPIIPPEGGGAREAGGEQVA